MMAFSAIAFTALVIAPAAPAGSYGMAGCGLGSQLLTGKTKGQQILAATTNDISAWTKISAMSSGTSNCTKDGTALLEKEQELFAELNYENLARDAASGKGEYLTAFGTLLGCSAEVQPRLAEKTQANYERIFAGEKADAARVVNSVRGMVHNDPDLAQGCSGV